jgi:DNA-binding response OmpR family regulator
LSEAANNTQKNRQVGEILIVDDEVFIRNAFRLFFETIGYRVHVADGGETALEAFEKSGDSIDVVLLDLIMPGVNGIDLLKTFKKLKPKVEVIIATGCGSLGTAIEAMRNGAFDYITKPIVDFDEELLTVVEAAVIRHRRSTQGATSGDIQVALKLRYDAQRLELLDRLISLARLGTQHREYEDAPTSIEETEKLLRETFDIDTCFVFLKEVTGKFETHHAWGTSANVPFHSGWFSNKQLFKALHDGALHVFTLEDVNTELLGMSSSKDLQPSALHLPLVLEGRHRGAMLAFFTKAPGERHSCLLEHGNDFLMAVPALSSLLLGALSETETPSIP